MSPSRILRVAELVRNDRAAVEAVIAANQPRYAWLASEVAAGTLLTLQLRRRRWDLRPRSVVLNAMLRVLNSLVAKADRVIIVGAAIDRDGEILAAQRAQPPELAGRWEFPGGKLERGESPATALVRECREELGVSVVVGAEVARVDLPTGALLIVLRAQLGGTEIPQAHEHLQLRWCRPHELPGLNWLDSNVGAAEKLSRHNVSDGATSVVGTDCGDRSDRPPGVSWPCDDHGR